MIPFIDLGQIHLGPLTIAPFGILVALGVTIGTLMALRFARKNNLNPVIVLDGITWIIITAFVVAHFVVIFTHYRDQLFSPWYRLLDFRSGISSFGGFLGALIGYWVYTRRKKIPFFLYGDAYVYGLAFGWFFGRLGCMTAHDHPGIYSTSFLAVQYPDGAKFDLGFLEALYTLVIIALFYFWGERKKRFPGFYMVAFILAYTPIRFALDFLRVSEPRLLDVLTLGQFSSIILFLVGVGLMIYHLRWIPRPRTRKDGSRLSPG